MSEMFACGNCDFKCVESQLSKSEGYCPKCNMGRADLVEKFKKGTLLKRGA